MVRAKGTVYDGHDSPTLDRDDARVFLPTRVCLLLRDYPLPMAQAPTDGITLRNCTQDRNFMTLLEFTSKRRSGH